MLWSSLKLTRAVQTATGITRGAEFNVVCEQDLAFFRSVLGDRGVVTEPDVLYPLNMLADLRSQLHSGSTTGDEPMTCRDWMGKYEGSSRLALKPQTTQQVSQLLTHCNKRQLAVVPQASRIG